MSVSDWDNEYARLARVASQLRSRGGGSDSDYRSLQAALSRLQMSLDHRLSPLLPSNEILRRRRLISHLQQNNNYHPNPSATVSATATQSASQSASQLAQQDEMIDDLAIGVERMKQQSQMIGDEAKLHLNLLGDMENQVDIAQTGLEGGTRRADQLRANKSIWRLQLIVVGLSVLLVLLVLTGLT